MKKRILKILSIVTVILLCLSFNDALAWENGGSIGGTPAGGGGSEFDRSGKNFYRVKVTGYRVTLVKYVKGSNNPQDIASKTYLSDVNAESNKNYRVYLENSGHAPIHYTSGGSKATLIKNGGNISWTTTGNNGKDGLSRIYGTNNTNLMKKSVAYNWSNDNDNNYVLNYYKALKDSNSDTVVKYIKDEFGIDIDNYEKLGCDQLVYYYILVEPMQIVEKYAKEVYFGTVSELKDILKDKRTSTYIYTPSTSFKMSDGTDLSFDYFGDGVGNSPSGTTDIANKNGYGVGVIWIGEKLKDACKKCYTRTITGDLTCKNVDKNNEALFYETYKETDCDKISSKEETNTENGRLIATKDNCNLYCVESAYASFPGGISPESELGKQIFQGSYFAWPKLHNSSNMNMYMTSSLECSFVPKNNGTCSNDEIATLKDAAVSEISGNKFKFNANLTAGTNREINEPLKQVDSKITVTSSKSSNDEQKYTVSKTVYFEIYENVNRIFDRTTGKVYDGTKVGIGQVDRGAGFISLGNNDDVDKEYDLKISNIELGSSFTKFGDRIKDYVCHYQLSQKCSCPPGTKYAGKSLQKYIDQGYTCVQAQNDKSIIEKECNNKYVCRNNTNIDISNCVENIIKNGGSENDAIEYCEKKELKCNPFVCKNTNSGTDISISECVYEKANGKNLIDNKEEIRKIAEECAKAEPECNNTCYDNVNFCIKYENKSKTACENEYKCCPEALTCEKEQGKSYTECFKEKCVNPYNYTCKFLGQTISLNDCISKEGKTYGQCFTEYCNTDTKCDTEPCYFCKTKSGENHDISSCVAREVAINNKTIKQAIKTCTVNTAECADYGKGTCLENCKWKRETKAGRVYYIKTCSDSKEICDTIDLGYCKDGKCQKIVYRTIDLNNPFPGKNGNGVTGDFSNNGTGRYPNSNWNYAPLVKEKILNARGVKGDELYKLEPLYTIILTPENMRNIKSKTSGYNDNNNYSDFTLKCLDTKNNSSCVSTFLRDSKYVTIDSSNSVCGNITNADEFKKCYERIN